MLEHGLAALAGWLVQADVGIGLLVLVGLSMSLSHLFALAANRLSMRQIAIQLVLDGLVLSVALLLNSLVTMLMLTLVAGIPVQPSHLLNTLAAALIPGLFYAFVAAPYISDLIALSIWFLIHLNVVTLLHAHFNLSYGAALMLSTPGFALTLVLVMALFHQSWQTGYRRLASELEPLNKLP